MKCSFVASVGQSEEKIWVPGIYPRYRLGALTTELRETLSELCHLLGSLHLVNDNIWYVARGLHTPIISNVESIVSVKINDDGKF